MTGIYQQPDLLEEYLVQSKPEIARNVPDNLFDFAEQLRLGGLKVDNYPFRWEGFEYLIEPYKSLRVTGEEDLEGFTSVWMCGAQVSKTTTAFITLVWLALRFWGRYFGYYLPDREMAQNFSAERFKPMVKAIPDIRPLWGADPSNDESEKQTDKKGVRSIGPSKIIFSYMQGVTSTEGWPLLGVIFDEVRRMMDGDIERTEERMSHSPYPINIKMSTAGYPDVNIDKAFKKSRQNKFHSKCRCKDDVVLADVFPDCIGEKSQGMTAAFRDLPRYFYVCPICKEIVVNPREGHWVPHNPLAKWNGWHIPQTLSCAQTPEKILTAFQECKDIQEFYNSKLGVAYISKEALLVTEAILRSTINPDLKWLKEGRNFAMGIDQMGGFNVIVIRYRGPKTDLGKGKSRLAHIEIVWDDDPWKRCDELMEQFDVSICVADSVPNFNEARRFAKRWPGRVFLAEYNYTPETGDDDICEWGDRPKETASEKKAAPEIKNKFRVRINRYLGLEWNLMLFVHRLKEQPHERGLVAEIQDTIGRKQTVFICQDVFWVHQQKLARRKKVNEETGETKMEFENIGLDPHFAHADLYAELALSRVRDELALRAFGEYAQKVPKPGDDQKGLHPFSVLPNGQHYKCTVCGITVAPAPGQTPQEAAELGGFYDCVRQGTR